MSLRWGALGAAILGLAVWAILAVFGLPVMPSYLAAWLFALAIPLGALPLVMALELLGLLELPVLPVLRRMLLLTPLVALFAIPVAVAFDPLYRHAPDPLPAFWMSPLPFILRMIVLLLLWSGLALLFARPPSNAPRRGLAALGLSVHLVLVTVAAIDWVMAVDPGLNSAAIGLLLMAVQMSIALAAALFIVAFAADRPLPFALTPVLGAVAGAWLFLQTTQWLVIWSADLPHEVAWYQIRFAGFGEPALWFIVTATLLAFVIMVPYGFIQRPPIMASVAAMLLLAHMVEILWLVAPTFRGGLVLAWADIPALLGLAGLALFVLSPAVKRGHYAAA